MGARLPPGRKIWQRIDANCRDFVKIRDFTEKNRRDAEIAEIYQGKSRQSSGKLRTGPRSPRLFSVNSFV